MMTLTTVGYGDIIPQNPLEYKVCTICMLVGAYIVAKIVTIIEAHDPQETQFQRQVDNIQKLMNNRGLPQDLQNRLRRYMHEVRGSTRQQDQQELLTNCISNHLQREVAFC